MYRRILRSMAVLLITASLLLMPNLAAADAGEDGSVVTANGYQIELVFKEPVAVGDNAFHIQITDSMGMPVPNAEVEVACLPADDMSAHEEAESAESSNTHSMSGMDMAAETPSTGAMPPDNGSEKNAHEEEAITVILEPAHASGEYSGEIALAQPGAWIFNVHFTVDRQMTTAEIPVEVVRAASNLGILAGFLGFNATIIMAAAIMKRRPILKQVSKG